jgi:hypothetical protein
MGSISKSSVLATLAAALLLGACGSSGIGDILGGPGGQAPNQIKGIVRSVDTRGDCRIDLDNATSASYLANGGYDNRGGYGGGRTSVYCDNDTRVVYQGQTFRPDSLEPGDEVIAEVSDVGGRLVANRIDVTYDVSRTDSPPYGGTPYPNDDRYDDYGRAGDEDLRGTVQRVDTRNRLVTLERVEYYDRSLDRDSRSDDLVTLYYDEDTRVSFRNQSYRPENLEPGDIVAVDVDQVRGTLVADDITVLADARGNAASYPR